MIDIVFEEMDDAIMDMVEKRIVSRVKRHPEAEAELQKWFAEKGINLIIKGWDNYKKSVD